MFGFWLFVVVVLFCFFFVFFRDFFPRSKTQQMKHLPHVFVLITVTKLPPHTHTHPKKIRFDKRSF